MILIVVTETCDPWLSVDMVVCLKLGTVRMKRELWYMRNTKSMAMLGLPAEVEFILLLDVYLRFCGQCTRD